MLQAASGYALVTRRHRRAFFWAPNTQQMRSRSATFREVFRELARALTALSAAAAWGAVLLLLAG